MTITSNIDLHDRLSLFKEKERPVFTPYFKTDLFSVLNKRKLHSTVLLFAKNKFKCVAPSRKCTLQLASPKFYKY